MSNFKKDKTFGAKQRDERFLLAKTKQLLKDTCLAVSETIDTISEQLKPQVSTLASMSKIRKDKQNERKPQPVKTDKFTTELTDCKLVEK